jgi:hypothetical protein
MEKHVQTELSDFRCEIERSYLLPIAPQQTAKPVENGPSDNVQIQWTSILLHHAFYFHFWIDFLPILQESGSTACSRYRPMAIDT